MKRSIEDLAILGGPPLFEEKLHVGKPNLGNVQTFHKLVDEIFERHWLTNDGPIVHQFEERMANLLGVKHCLAVVNATIGLEIAARALGLKGEVILPSFTFIATAHALALQGIVPVFCDVDNETLNIDPSEVVKLINSQTTGILGVHLWGRPCNISELESVADLHGLKLMFDAAHAIGCSYQGKMIGSFGDLEVFSFHATKVCNSFEGGLLATNSDEIAKEVRLLRNFGFAGYDDVVSIGTNGKMSEVSAAMALVSLDSLDTFVDRNQKNYCQYKKACSGIEGIDLVEYDPTEENNFQYVVLRINRKQVHLTRDTILAILWEENILARRYFYPGCHMMQPYVEMEMYNKLHLPVTEQLSSEILVLPTGTSISETHIRKMMDLLTFISMNSGEINDRISVDGQIPSELGSLTL